MCEPELPLARQRVRLPAAAAASAPAPPAATTRNARGYLSSREDVSGFDALREAIHLELVPSGTIELMWVDNISALEWEAHRLRIAKKAALDMGFRRVLETELRKTPEASAPARNMFGDWVACTLQEYFAGDPMAIQAVQQALGGQEVEADLIGRAYLEILGPMASLERLVLACEARRDGMLSNLYARRDLLERQRRLRLAHTETASGCNESA